jgi:hypothetical protein
LDPSGSALKGLLNGARFVAIDIVADKVPLYVSLPAEVHVSDMKWGTPNRDFKGHSTSVQFEMVGAKAEELQPFQCWSATLRHMSQSKTNAWPYLFGSTFKALSKVSARKRSETHLRI